MHDFTSAHAAHARFYKCTRSPCTILQVHTQPMHDFTSAHVAHARFYECTRSPCMILQMHTQPMHDLTSAHVAHARFYMQLSFNANAANTTQTASHTHTQHHRHTQQVTDETQCLSAMCCHSIVFGLCVWCCLCWLMHTDTLN